MESSAVNEEGILSILEWKEKADLWIPPITEPFASNNWVISGNLTDTGKPFLCNDPHMALTVPPVWYEIHYVVESNGEVFNVRGVTIPGIPLVIIGSNQYVGWGVTVVGADQADFYYYKWENETHYWYKGRLLRVKQVDDVIKVRTGGGFKEVHILINFTVHGPLVMSGGEKFALHWIGHQATTESYALWGLAHAHNITEFSQVFGLLSDPTIEFRLC